MRIMTECGKGSYRLFCLVAGIVLVLGQAIPALAVKISDVSSTKHSLSSGSLAISNWYSTDESEVCVFCHTPHNANVATPLWNQYSTTFVFQVYSSSTLDSYVSNPGGLPDDSISRLCLSCHEGTTAMNTLANPGSAGANPTMSGLPPFDSFDDLEMPAGVGAYISKDLRRMHPIGIDYATAKLGDLEIKDIDTGPKAKGLRFFGPGRTFLECPTCHDPHINGETA